MTAWILTLYDRLFNPLSKIALLIITMLLTACGSSSSDNDLLPSNQAQTEQGLVEGVEDETSGIVAFKGIPYAAPPVAELRFMPPAPAEDRSETLLADDYAGSCAQLGGGGGAFGSSSTNEDCLYLNIFTPDTQAQLPVMVWIHGGAFVSGSGNEPENNNPDYQPSYDPTLLVEQGLVVVTFNYRLGVLGFLAHPLLSAESGVGSGNYGLMDQQAALNWVQDNIENFGGDPNNVTIFGESAGGHSVLSHLVSPTAQGLFHKAIVQSGSYAPGQLSRPIAEALGSATAAALGCDSSDCLRGLAVETLLAAQAPAYVPTVDGNILTASIDSALTQADTFINQVPVMTGVNLHEGRLFTALDELNAFLAAGPSNAFDLYDSDADYRFGVQQLLSEDPSITDVDSIASQYLAFYDSEDPHRYRLALSQINTDWRFACHGLEQFGQLAAKGLTTYAYHFADENAPVLFTSISGFPLGAAHAFEIQYVLGSHEQMQARAGAGADISGQIALSETMVNYWAEFAKSGAPNVASAPAWSDFGSSNSILILAPAIQPQDASTFYATHNCAAW